VPKGLQSIINGLLNKKVGKRFQNGHQLYDALSKEHRTLQDHQDEQSYLPMQVRWTGIMGAVVGLVMIISVVMVFNVQKKLLTEQAVSAGVSLATFIASESAIHLLGEDWIGLDTLTDEAYKRKSFAALSIVDLSSVVRSSTDKSLVNKPWVALDNSALLSTREDVRIFEVGEDASNVYIFDSPINFNDTHIGNIMLSVSQAPLADVMSVTRRVLLVLGLSVTLVVLLAAYFLNSLVARNLLLVTRTIRDYASGNYSTRVSRRWKNEFGALANAFNAMAEKLQFEMHNENAEVESGVPFDGAEASIVPLDTSAEPESENGDKAAPDSQDESETDDAPSEDATIIQIRPES